MKVACLRHGITSHNLRGVFRGAGGEGLTPAQRAELESVEFDVSNFDAIYCSPAARCKETARYLGVSALIEDPRLAERNFGIFDGLTPDECRRRYPAEFEAFRTLSADFAIPRGESRAQHLERVIAWLREVSEAHEEVLAVTHGGTIDFFFRLGTGRAVHGGDQVFAGPPAALSVFAVSWPTVDVLSHGEPLIPSEGP